MSTPATAPRDVESAVAPEARDWDLRLPDLVLYAAPIALALFCLVVSQANHSVFWGFDEGEPATLLSTFLMIVTLLIAIAGARRPDASRPMRIVAGVMAFLAFVAVLDENLLWHENLGRQIRHAASSLPRRVTHYTDDVIVLLGAVLGGFILYYCIRYVARAAKTPRQRLELLPYLACVVFFGVAHGLLDIVGHGSRLVEMVWPHLSDSIADDYVERIGYFEEICKLWTEWFVVLLLLKLLFRQRGPLVWTLLAVTGSAMAVMGGLWGVAEPLRGIPALTVGDPLVIVRNFHSLFAITWIWVAWVAMLWVGFRRAPSRAELMGGLLVIPLAPVLGGLIDVDGLGRAVGSIAGALMPEANYGASVARHGLLLAALLIPGLVAGLVAGFLLVRRPLSTGLALVVACVVFSPWRSPSLTSGALLLLSGGMVVVSLLLGGRRRAAFLALALLASASVAASAWWAIGALSWAVFVWAREAPEIQLRQRNATLFTLAVAQLALSAALLSYLSPFFVPNHEWKPEDGPMFKVIQQSSTNQEAD